MNKPIPTDMLIPLAIRRYDELVRKNDALVAVINEHPADIGWEIADCAVDVKGSRLTDDEVNECLKIAPTYQLRLRNERDNPWRVL